MAEYKLTDVFDVDFLQRFQDAFSGATGMASISTDLEGSVTHPSNFTDFCNVFTRGNPVGLQRCLKCDLRGGEEAERTGRPAVYYCHAGLMDFGAPIIVNGKRVGSILGGQVLPAPPDEEKFRGIARELGINEEEYITALRKVKVVPEEQIRQAAELLYLSINEIGKVQTQYHRLETSHQVIQEDIDYIYEQVRSFSETVGDLSEAQQSLLERLHALNAILDNINRIVSAVAKISQRTKLISFNASVEAARSGVAGRGFAIIAQEIRNLADETSETLKQIEGYTDKVLDATRQVLEISARSTQSLGDQTGRLDTIFPRLDNILAQIKMLTK